MCGAQQRQHRDGCPEDACLRGFRIDLAQWDCSVMFAPKM